MITFNNIVERFEIFAENHFFIKTFSFGSPDDADLSKFTDFPLMHLVYTGANYDAGTKTYNIEVYILDVPADKNDKVERQKEVVSDAEQCAEDIIADIKNGGNIFLFAQDYEVVNATTTPLEEETKNVLSGVLLDLSVAIPYEWDACNAPIDGVEPGGTEVTYARRGVLRMLTIDGTTDVQSVRTINVTNGTLTDDGDGVVTLDTGGAETLNDLTDVDTTGVTDGQVLKYDNASGEWLPGNDQSATSLGNLDDVSIVTPANREALIYDGSEWVNDTVAKGDIGLGNVDNTSDADKPVSTATQTALDAKADTSAVPTELNDLSDVTITGTPTGNQALIYDGTANVFKSLPNFTNRFEDEAEINKQAITPFAERVYTVKADGDGIFIDAESDTPTAGKVIKRKIYQKAGFLESGAVIGDFTLIHTFADDTAYSATESTFEGFRDGDTYGTPPFTLIQTWEEVTAAPAFTGLLNETYGSGAEAAYSTRRLNGNVTECMVIRRASDSTTTTIGFDSNGNIDEAAITTFCSGTTCTVETWKDQSSNGNDATQSTPANQPTIYTGGALVKDGGRVAMTSTGSTSFDFTRISDINSVFSVLRPTDFTTTRNSFILGDTVNSDYHSDYNGGWLGNNSATVVRNGANYLNGSSVTLTGLTRSAGQYVLSMIHTANTARANTISQDRNAQYAQRSWIGNRQELIIYSDDRTNDRAQIESNVGDYFTQNTPLLDTYTGAAACYSLRLMRTAYTGSAIRVRRSSDNAEQDIGFNVFGELDTVSLLAFAGAGDAFVKTWYDQSGNSNDATQTNTANQPKIVSSGAVEVENGKPAVKFDGTNDRLTPTSTLSSPSEFSAFVIATPSATLSGYRGLYAPDSGASSFMVLANLTGTWGTYGSSNEPANSSLAVNSTALLSMLSSDGNSGDFYKDGSADGAFNDTSGQPSHIGGATGQHFTGTISEIIAYPSDESSNRANIETNINTFYSIY